MTKNCGFIKTLVMEAVNSDSPDRPRQPREKVSTIAPGNKQWLTDFRKTFTTNRTVHDVKYYKQSMNMETTRFTSWPSFRTVLKSNPFIKQIVKLRNFSHWKSSPGFHFVSQQWTIGGRIKGCCFPPERNVSICLHLYVTCKY